MRYTEDLEKRLAAEDRQKEEAFKEWQQEQQNGKQKPEKKDKVLANIEGLEIQIINYSEKAIAVIGDTKPIADKLQEIGGRFNDHLSCGPRYSLKKRRNGTHSIVCIASVSQDSYHSKTKSYLHKTEIAFLFRVALPASISPFY